LADVWLDPNYEDLTDLRLQEILELKPSALLLARRLQDCNEDRVAEAERMADAIVPNISQGMQERDLGEDMTVGEALQTVDAVVLVYYIQATATKVWCTTNSNCKDSVN
jgi:hypothetical protein